MSTAVTKGRAGAGGVSKICALKPVLGANLEGQLGVSLGALEARWGRTGAIRFAERYGGPVALLQAGGASAVVALQGAQVLSYVPAQQSEVLWLSPVARLGTGKAVRGGVPVCWPWFGPHPSDPAKPAHGFVRARPWSVTGSAATKNRSRLVLAYDASPKDASPKSDADWPNRALAEIEVTLADTLTVSLSTENRGGIDLVLTQALHTYLAVGDIGAVTVAGLEGQRFIDQLAPGHMRMEQSPIGVACEIDRIYQESGGPVIVTDQKGARQIRIAKTGSRSTVLWNPWVEKSARLGDMGDEGYRHMLCVEAANAGNDTVTLAPGERHRLTTELSVAKF